MPRGGATYGGDVYRGISSNTPPKTLRGSAPASPARQHGLSSPGAIGPVPGPAAPARANRGRHFLELLTQDETGNYLKPGDFHARMLDPESWDIYAESTGVVRNRYNELFSSSPAALDASQRYTDWYTNEFIPQSEHGGQGGTLYDWEFDQWTPSWEIGSSPFQQGIVDTTAAAEAETAAAEAEAQARWQTEEDRLQVESDAYIASLNNEMPFLAQSTPAPAVESDNNNIQDLLLAMSMGGYGREGPEMNPYGLGAYY